MTAILAIDPGPVQSAWLCIDRQTGELTNLAISPNEDLLHLIRMDVAGALGPVRQLVIEKVESFGMSVGAEIFETVFWTGRFAEAATPIGTARLGRLAVKMHLCHDSRARDSNIRQALLDRFGGKAAAMGRKAEPGPLYGIHGDLWSALAVGITWLDHERRRADQGEPA